METFWPNAIPEAARNRLHGVIHGMRRALRTAADMPIVSYEDGAYRLHPEIELWLDVDEFERHVRAGQRLDAAGEATAAMADYELAAALYQGDFLSDDPYEEWAVLPREHLRVAYLDVLNRLSELYFTRRRYGACVTLCQRLVELDPCREDGHRRLMRCHSCQGQPHLALRQYQVCVEALQAELGVDPTPATRELIEQIRRHEPV